MPTLRSPRVRALSLLPAALLLSALADCVGASNTPPEKARPSDLLVDSGLSDAECGTEGDATLTHAAPTPEIVEDTPDAAALESARVRDAAPGCGCGAAIHCGPTAGCDVRAVVCGSCAAPSTCGGGGKHYECGTGGTCTPLACEDIGKTSCSSCPAGLSCRVAGDGCGHAILCGPCQ
jgi:hypothetical protein